MRIDRARARALLTGSRAAFGVVALVAPRAIYPALAMRARDNADAGYLMRIFATRELFFAAMTAGIAGEDVRALSYRLGAAIDATDTVSLWLAAREGRAGGPAVAALTAGGAAFVAMGLLAGRAEP